MSKAHGRGRISQIHEAEARRKEKRKEKFDLDMRDFPCMFNLGCCNVDTEFKTHNVENLTLPDVTENKWRELMDTVSRNEDDEKEAATEWKENLMTRIYVEVNNLSEALDMNRQIVRKHENNLVAIANYAFLLFFKKEYAEADKVLQKLKKLKETQGFHDMKSKAIGEQGYAYCVFGGATNLLSSIELLSVSCVSNTQLALLHVQDEHSSSINERLEYFLALSYRRCTHLQIYSEQPDKINVHDFSLTAAKMLWNLGSNELGSKCVRAASLIELAYLNYGKNCPLEPQEWPAIVGQRNWKTLCDMALEVGKPCPSSKVLKMAGQLTRYTGDLKKAEELLKQSLDLRPSNRAHHHLGLVYRAKAIKYEQNNFPLGYRNLQFPRNPEVLTRDKKPLRILPKLTIVEKKQGFDLEYRLLKQVRFPGRGLKPFSQANPFVHLAVRHLEEACKISHNENKSAFHDLLIILLQCGRYEDFNVKCQTLIDEDSLKDSYPTYLTNAFNLYGVFYSLQAQKEKDEATRHDLEEQSDYYLQQSARLASQLGEDVPELSKGTTHLWSAHTLLTQKYSQTLENQRENRAKLFELCTLVQEYMPYLRVLDNILTTEDDSWDDVEALECGIQCYWDMGDSDGARKFLRLISQHSNSTHQQLLRKSRTARDIMLESGRSTLTSANSSSPVDVSSHRTDQNEWKQVFRSLNPPTRSVDESTHYDIIVAMDEDEDGSGTRYAKASRALVKVLTKHCDLNVDLAHEAGYAGMYALPQQLEAIASSDLTIFVVDGGDSKQTSDANCVSNNETGSKVSESDETDVCRNTGEASKTMDSVHLESLQRQPPSKICRDEEDVGAVGCQSDQSGPPGSISSTFDFVINSSVDSHLKDKRPGNIIAISLGSQMAIPSMLSRKPVLTLSDGDIQTLCQAASDVRDNAVAKLLSKLFEAM